MPRDDELHVYPLRREWARVFAPHLPAVRDLMTQAIRKVRYDFDPAIRIPREAGVCIDAPWPRTRTCAQAYHMYGYCHVIAPVMLALAQRAMPHRTWLMIHGVEHATVIADDDGRRTVLDLNLSHAPPEHVLAFVEDRCFGTEIDLWDSGESYVRDHLETFPFGQPKAMPLFSGSAVNGGHGAGGAAPPNLEHVEMNVRASLGVGNR